MVQRSALAGSAANSSQKNENAWRRWVENPYAFYYVPLAAATAVLLFVSGLEWRDRLTGVVVAALTAAWFHAWRVLVRTASGMSWRGELHLRSWGSC